MARVRIKAVPKMQIGGYEPITDADRQAYNNYVIGMRNLPGYNNVNWQHDQNFQKQAAQQLGFDYSKAAAIQADMKARNEAMPGSIKGVQPGDAWGGDPTWVGDRERQKQYKKYEYLHYDPKGNLIGHIQPGFNSLSENQFNSWTDQNRARTAPQTNLPPTTNPMDSAYVAPSTPAAPAPRQTGLATTGFPTREEAIAKYKARKASGQELPSNYFTGKGNGDYSIDSLRSTGKGSDEFAYGGATKRVRITGIPTMATGGYANKDASHGYGNQQVGQGYALNRFWNSPTGYPGSTAKVNPFGKVGNVLPEAEDGGDINAEKQERVLGDFDQDGQQELMNVDGPPHTQGGKNVNVPSNSFVFSDTKALKIKDPAILSMFGMAPKRGGYTPAEIAKKYDLNKLKKILDDPNADDFAKKTAQLMNDNYLAKLNKLASVQEGMKGSMGMEHHDPNRGQVPAEEPPVQEIGNMGQEGTQMMQPEMEMRYGGAPRYQIGGGQKSHADSVLHQANKGLDIETGPYDKTGIGPGGGYDPVTKKAYGLANWGWDPTKMGAPVPTSKELAAKEVIRRFGPITKKLGTSNAMVEGMANQFGYNTGGVDIRPWVVDAIRMDSAKNDNARLPKEQRVRLNQNINSPGNTKAVQQEIDDLYNPYYRNKFANMSEADQMRIISGANKNFHKGIRTNPGDINENQNAYNATWKPMIDNMFTYRNGGYIPSMEIGGSGHFDAMGNWIEDSSTDNTLSTSPTNNTGFVQSNAQEEKNTEYNMYPNKLTPDTPPTREELMSLTPMYGQRNKFKGYSLEEAKKIIKEQGNGHDTVPYTPELARGIGYDGRYGENTLGLQKWIREEAPGYAVSPGSGEPEGKLGIRTLSPNRPYMVNPWEESHDTPAIPRFINREQIDRLPVIVPTEHPVVSVFDPFPTVPSNNKVKTPRDKQRRGIFMNPNLYGDFMNAAQMFQLQKYQPYEPVPQAVIPDTVFVDPTRAIAAQQEMARAAMDMAGQSANARAARATGLAYQGEAGKQAADTIAQYANQNVGIANAANANAAQITNQLMAMEANRMAELNKGNFLAARDYQREMGRLQAEWADRKQKQHDTAVKTAWLNKTSPYFNIGPGGFPVFKPGDAEARYWKDIQGGSDTNFPQLIADTMKQYGWSFEQALGALTKGMGSVKKEQTDPVTGDKTTSTGAAANTSKYGGMMRYGGSHMAFPQMAPMYDIGGFIPLSAGPSVSFNAVDNTGYAMPVQSMESPEIVSQENPLEGLKTKKGSRRDIATITNNPGNIIYTPRFGQLFGAVDSGIKQRDGKGHFAMFPNLDTGFKAYQTQLFGDVDGVMKSNYYKKDTSVDQALKKWSNNGYDGSIYPEVKNKKLGELTLAERQELAKRQIKAESGDMYRLLRQRGVFKKYGGSALEKFMR